MCKYEFSNEYIYDFIDVYEWIYIVFLCVNVNIFHQKLRKKQNNNKTYTHAKIYTQHTLTQIININKIYMW